jgi:hypothetical protein
MNDHTDTPPDPKDEDASDHKSENEEFVEELENDPAHNPDDPELKRMQGG